MENYLDIFRKIDNHFVSSIQSINELKSTFSLKTLTNEIVNNNDWIDFICNNSYKHSNRFIKFSLFVGEQIKVRLHVYSNSQNILSNIHDHRWNFASLIIKGGYISSIYKLDNTGSDFYLYAYKSDANKNDSYSLEYVNEVKIKKISEKKFVSGDINNGKAGQIHRIRLNNSETTISLFITSHYEKSIARVFLTSLNAEKEEIKSKKLTKEELISKLKHL